MFVPTQSQEAPQQTDEKSASLPCETESHHLESAPFTLPLQLSVNTEGCSSHQHTSEGIEEDSQATQIEELEEPPGVDTTDSVVSCQDQKDESKAVPSESPAASTYKPSSSAESPKRHIECAEIESTNRPQKSTVSLNVQNVNVTDVKSDSRDAGCVDTVSCSQPKFDSADLTGKSCVQETPSDTTPCSLPSQSMITQTSAVDAVKSSGDLPEGTVNNQFVDSLSKQNEVIGNSQTNKNTMDKREQGEKEDQEVAMEVENTEGAPGMALVLTQSQLLSPEPMEEEESEDEKEDSAILIMDSERASQKDVTSQSKTNSSQPIRGQVSVSTNGHESQAQEKAVNSAPDRLSQTERKGCEPEVLKDKSLSDSSGGKRCTCTAENCVLQGVFPK